MSSSSSSCLCLASRCRLRSLGTALHLCATFSSCPAIYRVANWYWTSCSLGCLSHLSLSSHGLVVADALRFLRTKSAGWVGRSPATYSEASRDASALPTILRSLPSRDPNSFWIEAVRISASSFSCNDLVAFSLVVRSQHFSTLWIYRASWSMDWPSVSPSTSRGFRIFVPSTVSATEIFCPWYP